MWLLVIPALAILWFSLRFYLRVKLDNERRANRTQIHMSEYNDADVTYKDND